MSKSRLDEHYLDVFQQNLYPNWSIYGPFGPSIQMSSCISLEPAPWARTEPTLIKCAYCGNTYHNSIRKEHHNCPTCAGGWNE